MTTNEFIEGLNILLKHYPGEDGYHLGAEHDVIYAYPTNTPLTTEEVQAMHKLGWHQEDAVNDDGEWLPELYDPEEGWAAFV